MSEKHCVVRRTWSCCRTGWRNCPRRNSGELPAYIVFGDKVLREMVARRPTTRRELLHVPGVGEAKLERYGAAFLEVWRGG